MKKFYGFCLAAPRSGEGKTTLSIGLMRAFTRRAMAVQGFKCGPDYIDPTFHTQATGRASCNIDTWMMGEAGVKSLWSHRIAEAGEADMGICEGVMGLFDGKQVGSLEGSTLHVAKTLTIPVILVFNAKGMAASVAALARGFCEQAKDYGVTIGGFIANNVGSTRHEHILQDALHHYNLPPLLGALPRNDMWKLPQRHLGLIPSEEVGTQSHWYDALANAVEKHCRLDELLQICLVPRPTISANTVHQEVIHSAQSKTQKKRIAVAKDKAFCFYYEENERVLKKLGHEILPFSPLVDVALPKNIDAVYLGGGYPEVFAKELSENASMRQSIYQFAQNHGEIYAECGGYMYLCKHLVQRQSDSFTQDHAQNLLEDTPHNTLQTWDMCGVINATATMGKGIRSLGYRQATLLCDAPFALTNTIFRGHEYHWSDIEHHQEYAPLYDVVIKDKTYKLGLIHKNVKAGYVHLYWGIGCHEG